MRMGIKSKYEKLKKQLKKAKGKIKNLKSKNIKLLAQLESGETNDSEMVEIIKKLDQPIMKPDALSKNMNAKEAIKLFQAFNDPEEIKRFTKGDSRPSLVQRAKSRINALTNT